MLANWQGGGRSANKEKVGSKVILRPSGRIAIFRKSRDCLPAGGIGDRGIESCMKIRATERGMSRENRARGYRSQVRGLR